MARDSLLRLVIERSGDFLGSPFAYSRRRSRVIKLRMPLAGNLRKDRSKNREADHAERS
jgi:hypothetical protein